MCVTASQALGSGARGPEIKASLDLNFLNVDNTWPVGNLGGISLVKRQGRETTREIKTPRQSRLIRDHIDDILSGSRA